MKRFIFLLFVLLAGCVEIPEGIEPVGNVDLERYAGKWYEIARLDNRFEEGLSQVTATYTQGEGNNIRVLNRGYDAVEREWKEAEGKARPVGGADSGRLMVSFFGPFYSGYNIIALDRDEYQWSVVTGNDRSYFWILARKPFLSEALKTELVSMAKAQGFDVDQLVWPQDGR